MNITPKKSAYFLSLGILVIGFFVVITFTSKQLTTINDGVQDVTSTPLSVSIEKEDAFYIYMDLDTEIVSVDLDGNDAVIVTNEKTYRMRINPGNNSYYEYYLYEIDPELSISTDLYKPVAAVYVDFSQSFTIQTSSGEGLLLSPLTDKDIGEFGGTLRIIAGISLVIAVVVFVVIYRKRAKAMKFAAVNETPATWMDDVEVVTDNPFEKEVKPEEDSFNDF
jgi:flagellar biosynthesis/type III secretory pathway M-ring protein FliF/YscJ